MPAIKPFKGILYNPSHINDISKVVSPPYDILSKSDQDRLYRSSPYNIVRLILGRVLSSDTKYNNKYTRAKRFLLAWLKKGVLKGNSVPAIYLYEQGYIHEKRHIRRVGFIAALKLEEFGERHIFPHEETFAGPKLDRLNLIRTVMANLSPIFCLFQDKANITDRIFRKYMKGNRPIIDIKYDSVVQRLWRVTDEALIEKISFIMKRKKIFIADGHHRYEASLRYMRLCKKESCCRGDAPCDYIMTFFLNTDSETPPTILAAHRILKRMHMAPEEFLKSLLDFFVVSKANKKGTVVSQLKRHRQRRGCFGLLLKDEGWYFLRLKGGKRTDAVMRAKGMPKLWAGLDVVVLRRIIFEKILKLKDIHGIEYTTEVERGAQEVSSGRADCFFVLNPTRMSQVSEIAQSGLKMPHKSTYFYPKLLDGLVINKLW